MLFRREDVPKVNFVRDVQMGGSPLQHLESFIYRTTHDFVILNLRIDLQSELLWKLV